MKNKMKYSVFRYFRRVMNDAELDADEGFHLEVNSLGEITVKGCKDIMSYSENEIMLTSDSCFVTVKGNALQVKQFMRSLTVISGETDDICFIKR